MEHTAEIERVKQRFALDFMIRDFSLEEQNEIQKEIEEYKKILKSDYVSTEIIALIVFYYKNNKDKHENSLS